MAEELIVKDEFVGLYEDLSIDVFVLRPLSPYNTKPPTKMVRSENLYVPYSLVTKQDFEVVNVERFKAAHEEHLKEAE